jgi:hypothetical protein
VKLDVGRGGIEVERDTHVVRAASFIVGGSRKT